MLNVRRRKDGQPKTQFQAHVSRRRASIFSHVLHLRVRPEPNDSELKKGAGGSGNVQNHSATHATVKICTCTVAWSSPSRISFSESCSPAEREQESQRHSRGLKGPGGRGGCCKRTSAKHCDRWCWTFVSCESGGSEGLIEGSG